MHRNEMINDKIVYKIYTKSNYLGAYSTKATNMLSLFCPPVSIRAGKLLFVLDLNC